MTDGKVTQEDFSNNETQAMLETIFFRRYDTGGTRCRRCPRSYYCHKRK